MNSIIQWFKATDWLANAFSILLPLLGVAAWFWRRTKSQLARPRSFSSLVKATLQLPLGMSRLQSIAEVAIVDDNLSDFPVQDLRKAGFQIKTYKHVTVADFDELSHFDVVFLDMHNVVRDDPTEGGLKLIRILRQKNARQKICAVSGNQFNPSATAFFKLADDTLNKPMSAQRCAEVLESFLREKLNPEVLAQELDDSDTIPPPERKSTLRLLGQAVTSGRTLSASDVPAKWPSHLRGALTDLSRVLTK